MRSVPVSHSPRSARPSSPVPDEDRIAAQRRANAELLERVLQDPPAGLAALHDRFAKDVNRLVWRLLGADAEHEDIVQQVFFRVLTSIHRLREPERLDAWVRAITVNTVRGELRSRAVRRALRWNPPDFHLHGDLNFDVEQRELIQQSVRLLNKLPAHERIVFGLYHLEDFSLPEVAEMCGYSLMTAKRRLAAARRRVEALVRSRPELLERLRAAREDS